MQKSSTQKIRQLIEKRLGMKGEVRTADIVRQTGFSRTYVNRIFQDLQHEGKIRLVGKANRARYVSVAPDRLRRALDSELTFGRILLNSGLREEEVFRQMERETGILTYAPGNVIRIVEYAFTEMLNNAIEHSASRRIRVFARRSPAGISFSVIDAGVGIFKRIRSTRNLKSEQEAIQDLLKGKLTTDPERHSGEGIFFTSKAADHFEIGSSTKKIIFDNRVHDVFLRDIRKRKGTLVNFWIDADSQRDLGAVFRRYTDRGFAFDKTQVAVDLYKTGAGFVSRSEARRILTGLEEFNTIILDFKNVETVGQGFADEIFRVWKSRHPDKIIEVKNAAENVRFMISHVQSG